MHEEIFPNKSHHWQKIRACLCELTGFTTCSWIIHEFNHSPCPGQVLVWSHLAKAKWEVGGDAHLKGQAGQWWAVQVKKRQFLITKTGRTGGEADCAMGIQSTSTAGRASWPQREGQEEKEEAHKSRQCSQ